MNKFESTGVALGASLALLLGGCATENGVQPSERPTPTATSVAPTPEVTPTATPAEEITPIIDETPWTDEIPEDAENALSYKVCNALAWLVLEYGPDDFPFVITDESSPYVGYTIADDVDRAANVLQENLLVEDAETGEAVYPADPASLDALVSIQVTEPLVGEIRDFLENKTLSEVTSKKNQAKFKMIQEETNYARDIVTEALTNQCPAEEQPYER